MSDPQQTTSTLREEQLLVDLEAFKANHTEDAETRIYFLVSELCVELQQRQRGRDRREKIRQLVDSGRTYEEVQQELNPLLLEEEREAPELKAAFSRLRELLEQRQRQD